MRKKNGITLVALVITIIVLLILAGISLSQVVGNNGIASKSQTAKSSSIVSQEKELANVAYTSALPAKYNSEVTEDDFQRELDKLAGANKASVIKDETGFIVTYTETGHSYYIEDGQIEQIETQELHITNYDELLDFANRVNSGESFRYCFVYLDNDIAMPNTEWVMIGYYGGRDDPSVVFDGIFNGNNHTISGLVLPTSRYKGLFYGNDGTIKNLNVEASCTGGGISGAICASNYKNIINCSANLTANMDSQTDNTSPSLGGICGSNSGTVKDCYATGELTSTGKFMKTGGIVGSNGGTITNCINEATIISTTQPYYTNCTGGITGYNHSGQITKCINNGLLNLKCAYGGGIVGESYNGSIDECANKGNIVSNDPATPNEIAGLVGRTTSSTITNSYNTGSINYDKSIYNNYSQRVAGLVADMQGNVTIANCYASGTVTIPATYAIGYAAFGSTNSVTTNCYYDSDVTTLTTNLTETVATGLTTAEMKASSFVEQLGDAYVADTNNLNNGYPVFSWE